MFPVLAIGYGGTSSDQLTAVNLTNPAAVSQVSSSAQIRTLSAQQQPLLQLHSQTGAASLAPGVVMTQSNVVRLPTSVQVLFKQDRLCPLLYFRYILQILQ